MNEIEFRKLLESGKVDWLDISMIEKFAQDKKNLSEFVDNSENPYSKIILVLAHIEKKEDEAKKLWKKLVKHLDDLEEKLERKVGLSVAVLDYFQNIEKKESNLKLFNDNNLSVLSTLAVTDGLTTLYSKDILDIFLEKMFEDAYRNDNLFCLVMIDVDNFGIINEIHGREEGDKILEEISIMILNNIRKMDIAFRYGDDELAIILPTANKQQAHRVMEVIRILIRNHYEDNLEASISIGISENTGFLEYEEIIQNAKEKLLEAKKKGKNRTRY